MTGAPAGSLAIDERARMVLGEGSGVVATKCMLYVFLQKGIYHIWTSEERLSEIR